MKMLTCVSSSPTTYRRHLVPPLVLLLLRTFSILLAVSLYIFCPATRPQYLPLFSDVEYRCPKNISITPGKVNRIYHGTPPTMVVVHAKKKNSSELGLNNIFNRSPELGHADNVNYRCSLPHFS